MPANNKTLKAEFELVFQQLVEGKNKKTAVAVQQIILTNLEQLRVERWLGEDKTRSPGVYVHLVTETYEQYQPYIHRLQIERSEIVWAVLFKQLQHWAYSYLLCKGFHSEQTTFQLAVTLATEAAITLLTARFPYDVPFDPWAHVLLLHVCRRHIRQAKRQSVIPDGNLLALHEELVHDSLSLDTLHLQEARHDLLDAIAKLPDSWQQVILLQYFDNLSPAEIAGVTGKTPSAVYNLHFKAISRLREIMADNRHNDE
ncbi:MAG TPA: sigma-70 family RNA polymerase sigma factor [Chloroflexota bacterium]|nr:sigma-70 family RNA polymerase sigma factor [Chloroflexota bacterium]HUM69296.1 sigma-70 family RNA polymerase sigma factor [Chloroflexota bacterium]